MPTFRAYRGPDPGHPAAVVPADPARHGAVVRVRGWEVVVADPVETITSVAHLCDVAVELGWNGDRPGGPPFDAGLVGLLTDDLSPGLLDLDPGDDRPAPADLPPVWFGHYDHAACRDPLGGWWLTARSTSGLGRAEALLRGSTDRTSRRGPTRAPADPEPAEVAWTSLSRDAHRTAVRQVKDWIAAGDVYQVNLTMHVAAPWARSHLALAKRLFGANQGAAHAAYVHAPGATITSVSPETFLRIDGRRATVRPIKGTRRRSADAAEDARLSADLAAAVKDSAEHVMIVDLERNDLGRISEIGSVRVPELMALESHPTVWHLTSTVEGTLRPAVTLSDTLTALFPCGSVTGAPKRMAVDRIRQLEPWRRGVYCGAIGVVTGGLVDLSVAIRTAVIHDGRAWYGTGGGIVTDSDADAEWDEAMDKAAAFFTATGTRRPS